MALHRGSIFASHPAAPGSNPGSAVIFSPLLSLWTVEKLNPSSAYARDFANAVQRRPELSTTKKYTQVTTTVFKPIGNRIMNLLKHEILLYLYHWENWEKRLFLYKKRVYVKGHITDFVYTSTSWDQCNLILFHFCLWKYSFPSHPQAQGKNSLTNSLLHPLTRPKRVSVPCIYQRLASSAKPRKTFCSLLSKFWYL